MNIENDIRQLERLLQQGILTKEEFEQERARLLSTTNTPQPAAAAPEATTPLATVLEQGSYSAKDDARQNGGYALALHLILLVPYIGWIITLVMWGVRRTSSPLVDAHGKGILNFLLSTIIYVIIFALLVGLIVVFAEESASTGGRPQKISPAFVMTLVVIMQSIAIYGLL